MALFHTHSKSSPPPVPAENWDYPKGSTLQIPVDIDDGESLGITAESLIQQMVRLGKILSTV